MRLRFRLVNVFAESVLGGNPLCVFEDGSGLDTVTMQALALQFNLSETTFLLPPDQLGATQRVRIFTPTFELAFAGHPTLGTAHVVRDLRGGGDEVSLQMQAGVIPVRAAGDRWTLQANQPIWFEPALTRMQLAEVLRIAEADVLDGALWVDTGSEQLVIPLASPEAVERCRPRLDLLARYCIRSARRGVAYVWSRIDDERIRVRYFMEQHGGVLEDPGTGSACANLGGWFIATNAGLPIAVTLYQGDHVGRPSQLGLNVDLDQHIFVSGRVIPIGHGEISLPGNVASS